MTISSDRNEAIYRRECTRFSVVNDDWATLSDGANCMEAQCTDRSAEGFGVCCEGMVPWSVGQTILLNRAEGACEVQIMHLVHRDGKTRMGVRRVRDCVEEFQTAQYGSPWGWFWRSPHHFVYSDPWTLGLCFVSLAGVVVAALVISSTISFGGKHGSRSGTASRTHAPRPLGASGVDANTVNRSSSGDEKNPEVPRESSSDERWNEVVSGNREVAWTDIENLLNLNTDQSGKLRALLSEKLREVSFQGGDVQAAATDGRARLTALNGSLSDQNLSFLDHEQQAKLKSLLTDLSRH
ncbi:MAG: hypothetical protein ACYC3X_18445 [Pirellulaceae bacterium]